MLIIDYWSEPDEGDLRWVCVCRLTCRSWWSTPDFIGLRSDVDHDDHDQEDQDDQNDGDGHDDEGRNEDEKDGKQTLMRFNNMLTLQSDVDYDGQDEDGHDHHEDEVWRWTPIRFTDMIAKLIKLPSHRRELVVAQNWLWRRE